MDGFYLLQEGKYRNLYDAVRVAEATDFAMNAIGNGTGGDEWIRAVFSKTMLVLYVPMLVVALIVLFVLLAHSK